MMMKMWAGKAGMCVLPLFFGTTLCQTLTKNAIKFVQQWIKGCVHLLKIVLSENGTTAQSELLTVSKTDKVQLRGNRRGRLILHD